MNTEVSTKMSLAELETQIQKLEALRLEVMKEEVNREIISLHKNMFEDILNGLNKKAKYEIIGNNLMIEISNPTDASQDEEVLKLENPTVIKGHTSRPRPKLIVTFPNDSVISGRSGKIAFVKAIEKIVSLVGFDKVQDLGYRYSDIDLVSYDKDTRPNYQTKYQTEVGDLYVMTFINSKKRVEILNNLSNKFNLNLDVRLAYKS